MATSYPKDIENYHGWMTGMLGPGVAPLSRALLNPSGLNTNEILRELWASWEGDNFLMSEFFLRALTMRGEYIRRLLPIEEYDKAIRDYGLRAKGDQVTFDTWNFESAVLPDQSRRHPGRRAEDEREQHSRAFRGGGVGFEVPLDWLEHPTTQRHFQMKIEQMNRTIFLTWTFRVLQTIMYEGLDIYARRLQRLLPLSHEEFSVRLDELVSRTFLMNKNGTNFSGMEARVVNQGQTRDVIYDVVLTPPNSTEAMKISRAPLNLYYMRGPEVLNSNKQAKDLAPEGNRTVHYGLNVYESREFPMGNGAPNQDPLANQCMVSQRFVMLPLRVMNGFQGYRSCHRDIKIPDGENRVWKRLTLRSALNACGIFAPRARSGERYLTTMGAQILTELCTSRSTRDGSSYRANGVAASGERHAAESGTGSYHFPTATLPEGPGRQGVEMPACATAFNLFRNAGIAREMVDHLASLSPEKYAEFHTVLRTTAKDLRSTARDQDFDARGDTFESRFTRDEDRYDRYGVSDELEAYIPPTGTTRAHARAAVAGHPVVGGRPGVVFRAAPVLGGGGGLARFAPEDPGMPLGGVESTRYDLPHQAFDDALTSIAQFLLNKVNTTPDQVNRIKRDAKECLPVDAHANLDNCILPILKIDQTDGRPFLIPYASGSTPPRTLEDLGHDAYWRTLATLGADSRLNTSPVQAWVKEAAKYVQEATAHAAGGAAPTLHVDHRRTGPDYLELAARSSWSNVGRTYNVDSQSYWAAMALIGRGVQPAAFNTNTPMLGDNGRDLMLATNSLSLVALTHGACSEVDRAHVRAFVAHLVDHCDPTRHDNLFVAQLLAISSMETPSQKVDAIVEFMKGQGIQNLLPSEKAALRDALTGDTGAVGDLGADASAVARSKRARGLDQTPKAIEAMLQALYCDFNFFDALIRCDLPFPIAFILFRMHIRVQVSSVVFMVAGPSTGVVVIKDGWLNFTRRQADFALDVGTRFRTATFITNRDNIELCPHAMAKRYLGGAGSTLYDPNTDTAQYRNGAFIKDIFVMAVPYDWQPEAVWTDITGRMNPNIYNGAARGLSLNHTQYKTNEIYTNVWGFHHDQAHIFSAQAMGGLLHNPTLALQATQRVHNGDDSVDLKHIIEGHDPMGRRCEPIDYQILNGSTAVSGTGLEDFIPRKQLIAGY